MATPEKVSLVDEIKAEYASSARAGGGVVFAEYHGVSVESLKTLRKTLREKSVKLKVFKNTLLKRALSDAGVAVDSGLADVLKGPTIVAFTPDEVSAPKIMKKFADGIDKDSPARLVMKGAVIGGKIVSSKEVAALAVLPSREEVFATLLALMNTPAISLLRLMKEPAARTARLVKAVSDKATAQNQ